MYSPPPCSLYTRLHKSPALVEGDIVCRGCGVVVYETDEAEACALQPKIIPAGFVEEDLPDWMK
jgi:hypothetical protein